jgi:hypothetical protein
LVERATAQHAPTVQTTLSSECVLASWRTLLLEVDVIDLERNDRGLETDTLVGIAFQSDGLLAIGDESDLKIDADGVEEIDVVTLFLDDLRTADELRRRSLSVTVGADERDSTHEYPLAFIGELHLHDDLVVEMMELGRSWRCSNDCLLSGHLDTLLPVGHCRRFESGMNLQLREDVLDEGP